MTQIDSTAQTDLGISDHEELLLPYKAIYSQLLDTIREVVKQTLDSTYGTGAHHITNEVLELALKDNLSALLQPTEKTTLLHKTTPEPSIDPKLLKLLQNSPSAPIHPQADIFSQTTSQLLKLIEMNTVEKKQYSPFLGSAPAATYPTLHKSNPYTSLLSQQAALFKPRQQETSFTKPFPPHLLVGVQKPFHEQQQQSTGPKIFSPGVIKMEDTNRVSPPAARSPPNPAFTDIKPAFSPSSPFTSVSPHAPVSPPNLVTSLPARTILPHSSPLLLPSSLPHSSPLLLPSSHQLTSSSMSNLLLGTSSPLLNSGSPLFSNTPTTLNNILSNPATSLSNMLGNQQTSLSNMEVHQHFIKQINLLNQTAPSMLGQKIRIPGQEKGQIEKVLMDIQCNLTNMKPVEPWNTNKDKLYKCPHCETAFARRQYLSNHIINVHNLKTCPECKTTFSNEEAFNAHLAQHPKKEYECGSCNKSFNSVYLLKNHRKTHVKDKPFACNICGKTFADKYYLRNHFSIHSPVKPYSCPVCGRGFASSSALRYHSFQHTGEKPAKCQYCPSEFVQKNQLKLHIARKHKDLINNLNPLHEGDIIPGNMSLGSRCCSPASSPAAHRSPGHKAPSPLLSSVSRPTLPTPPPVLPVVSSGVTIVPITSSHIPIPTRAPAPAPAPVEQMQVDVEKKSDETKGSPTVSMATEQLHELIASLQRGKPPGDQKVSTASNFTLSSPFSKITDGINQLLEGAQNDKATNQLST